MKCLTETNRNFKGVIFDLDGTLLDTLSDLTNSVNEAMKDFGAGPYSREEVCRMVGSGFRVLITRALPKGHKSEREIDAALADFVSIYDRRYRETTRPYEGIPELLAALTARKIPVAVNSNKRDDYTKALIAEQFPAIPFAGVYGERAGIGKKPDPQTAWELAETMGLAPEEVLYVGDSQQDIQTGIHARMGRVGVSWGFRSVPELIEAGADYILEKPEELAELL